jgi:uncharacterized membrane protein
VGGVLIFKKGCTEQLPLEGFSRKKAVEHFSLHHINNRRENSGFLKSDRMNMNLQEAVCSFAIISHIILVKNRNSAPSIYRGNQNTKFMMNMSFSENCAVNEIVWKNM